MLCQRGIFRILRAKYILLNSCHFIKIHGKSEPGSPIFSVAELINILNAHNFKFEDGYTCFRTNCLNCAKTSRENIYINKTTGLFMCMDCQEMGDWNCFESRMKPMTEEHGHDKKKETRKPTNLKLHVDVIEEYSEKWNELKTRCRILSSLSKKEQEEILDSFGLPAQIDAKILNQFGILYDHDSKVLNFPLSNGGKRIVGIMELNIDGNEKCYPFKKCAGVLKHIPNRVTKKCNKVVLVHKIKYLLALGNQIHDYHVVCLPHGTAALPQEILPLLEQYSKIVIWFGTDKFDLTAAKVFSKKLKEQRCFLFRDTDESILFDKKQNITKIFDSAQSMIPENVITFADLKDDIYSGLINTDQNEGVKWKRFPSLNKILRGHRRGELTVFTGPTGSGKTTFLSEYSMDLAMQGVSTLWGSFEIRNQRLLRTMLQQFSPEPLVHNLHNFEKWSYEFGKLPLYFLKFHGQQPIESVMKVVEHATYVHDIQHVIIDNLQFMLGLSTSDEGNMDRFLKQDLLISALRSFATYFDCHVTIVIHPRKEKDHEVLSMSSIFGGVKATQEADNVLIIQQKMTESLHIKKYLQVVKNRFTGDLGVMPLVFNKSILSFGCNDLKNTL